jgi:predicted kinase
VGVEIPRIAATCGVPPDVVKRELVTAGMQAHINLEFSSSNELQAVRAPGANATRAVILNPRGPGGSGKSELVRRIMRELDHDSAVIPRPRALYRTGRDRPAAYRLPHPNLPQHVFVLGHYERTAGGCDTFRKTDGGIDELFRLAHHIASRGHFVVMESLVLSSERPRTRELARRHDLHILQLATKSEECSRNLIRRRRLSRSAMSNVLRRTEEERLSINAACKTLAASSSVHHVEFDQGLSLARRLLQLPSASP